MIPRKNVKDLMLRKDVVKAVEDGKFNIWAVTTIDEGIETLTGKIAGKRNKSGRYPEGTIHFLANKKLEEFAGRLKEFGAGLL